MTNENALVERIRPILSRRKGFSEKKMFGGVCLMINGNMCVGTWKESLIVRLDKKHRGETLVKPHTRPLECLNRMRIPKCHCRTLVRTLRLAPADGSRSVDLRHRRYF